LDESAVFQDASNPEGVFVRARDVVGLGLDFGLNSQVSDRILISPGTDLEVAPYGLGIALDGEERVD